MKRPNTCSAKRTCCASALLGKLWIAPKAFPGGEKGELIAPKTLLGKCIPLLAITPKAFLRRKSESIAPKAFLKKIEGVNRTQSDSFQHDYGPTLQCGL